MRDVNFELVFFAALIFMLTLHIDPTGDIFDHFVETLIAVRCTCLPR